MTELAFQWIGQYGYPVLFLLLVLGIVGLPIPDEGLVAFAGFLVYKGDLYLVPVLIAAYSGTIAGITLSYGLGRLVGLKILDRYGSTIHVGQEEIAHVEKFFHRGGKWALTFGYFVPGIRHLTAFVAGTSKLDLSVFALFAYSGGFLWSITFIGLGYLWGKEWVKVSVMIHRHVLSAPLALVTIFVLGFFLKRLILRNDD